MRRTFCTNVSAAVLFALMQCAAVPLASQGQDVPSLAEIGGDRIANEAALSSVESDEKFHETQLVRAQSGSPLSSHQQSALQTLLNRDRVSESKILNNIQILDRWVNYLQTVQNETMNWNTAQTTQSNLDRNHVLQEQAQTLRNEQETDEGRQYYIEKNRPAPSNNSGSDYDGWNSIPINSPL